MDGNVSGLGLKSERKVHQRTREGGVRYQGIKRREAWPTFPRTAIEIYATVVNISLWLKSE